MLALLHEIPLGDVIKYIIEYTEYDDPHTLRFKNEKIIREYATVDDSYGILTYTFNFENSNILLTVNILKEELLGWYNIKSRTDKINRIRKNINFL